MLTNSQSSINILCKEDMDYFIFKINKLNITFSIPKLLPTLTSNSVISEHYVSLFAVDDFRFCSKALETVEYIFRSANKYHQENAHMLKHDIRKYMSEVQNQLQKDSLEYLYFEYYFYAIMALYSISTFELALRKSTKVGEPFWYKYVRIYTAPVLLNQNSDSLYIKTSFIRRLLYLSPIGQKPWEEVYATQGEFCKNILDVLQTYSAFVRLSKYLFQLILTFPLFPIYGNSHENNEQPENNQQSAQPPSRKKRERSTKDTKNVETSSRERKPRAKRKPEYKEQKSK